MTSNKKPPSQNSIGRALGLSSAGMVKLKKQGCPVDSVESVRAWREANQNIAARKPEPNYPASIQGRAASDEQKMIRAKEVNFDGSEMEEAHAQARTRREIAEANMAEIREAELAGKYVEKEDVERAVFEAARGFRDGLANCSRRLAAEVATLTTPAECEAVIAKELRHLLDAFSRQLTQKVTPVAAEEN
jgi:hypothetical protein